jgi:hypothetical protein
MQNNTNDTSGSMKSKFEDFGAVPSDKVWKGVSAAIQKKRKRRFFLWWFWVLSLFALAGVTFFSIKMSNVELLNNGSQAVVQSKSQAFSRESDSKHEGAGQNPVKSDTNSTSTKENQNKALFDKESDSQNKIVPSENRMYKSKKGLNASIVGNGSGSSYSGMKKMELDSNRSNIVLDLTKNDSAYFLSPLILKPFNMMRKLSVNDTNKYVLGAPRICGWRFNLLMGKNLRLKKEGEIIMYDQYETQYQLQRSYEQYYLGLSMAYQFNTALSFEMGFLGITNRFTQEVKAVSRVEYKDFIWAVPLKINWNLYRKSKFQIECFGGVQLQYMYRQNDISTGMNLSSVVGNTNLSEDYVAYNYSSESGNFYKDKINMMTQLGFHFNYNLNSNWALRLSPYYQYYTKKCARFSYVTTHNQHWVGLELGIQYRRLKVK